MEHLFKINSSRISEDNSCNKLSSSECSNKRTTFRDNLDLLIDQQSTDTDSTKSRISFKLNNEECLNFMIVDDFAQVFTNDIIRDAVKIISKGRPDLVIENEEPPIQILYIWPKIMDFTINLGTESIENYLNTWTYTENWKFCVNFLQSESDECSDFHKYEAIFSIPSKQYPIAQATASIYFTIEISKIKPNTCPVNVIYVFEGNRLVHIPGKYKFKEDWLFNIIESKIKFFKTLNF